METKLLRDIKQGDYVKRKPGASAVYVRGHYDPRSRTYSLTDVEDINREIFLRGSTQLFIGFDY